MNFDVNAGQYGAHFAGVGGSRAGQSIEGSLSLQLPQDEEELKLFDGATDWTMLSYDEKLQWQLQVGAAHNTQDSRQGGWNALNLAVGFGLQIDSEYQDEPQVMQADLGIRYQRLAEEPVLHLLTDVRIHFSPTTDSEVLEAYISEAETSLMGWGFKVMSTLPPALLQEIMATTGFFW